jgi:RecA-family ATPase
MTTRSNAMRLSDIDIQELKWLWYPYIPYANSTMIFGPGGHGKSFLSSAIATAISTGDPLPGQTGKRDPGMVLMLSAEDDASIVLRPRLEAMGADLKNIWVPKDQFNLSMEGVKKLRALMRETMATLVTIDPMVSYIGGKIDMNKMNEVRSVLGELQKLAMDTGTAMILFHHSRKSGKEDNGEDYEKAAGSADFVNAVRSAMLVKRAADGKSYLLKHVKANYGPQGDSIGFQFGSDPVFEWGDFYSASGEKVMLRKRERPAREKAWQFVSDYLKDGPKLVAEIIKAADDAGINTQTLYRAIRNRVNRRYVRDGSGHAAAEWSLILKPEAKDPNVLSQGLQERVKNAMARLNAKEHGE